jgi:5S rRNA maturation endonuclease (ribonuclease M5)
MATEKRSGFINVDELLPQVTLEQAAAFYGVQLPELKRVGQETRTRCFLACGRTQETGDRALSIQTDHPAKQWKCFQYGCTKSGTLIALMDLLKPGANMAGRPRGDRFKTIAADLVAMTQGMTTAANLPPPMPSAANPEPAPIRNIPLAQSDNERARDLVNLDAKFVTDPAAMPPAASRYVRTRPFFCSEACKRWRTGYLPRDTGDDKSGGTMRGRIVYAYASETGEVLTWFGRDPEFEEKHARWIAGGRVDREPEKFHFVKGFHRGLELFGQHALCDPSVEENLRQYGLVIVEGPNDVIALDALGVPAVGLCSNTITREQAEKAARLAIELAGGIVTLMLDCDPEGENGMQQVLPILAELLPVQLGWSPKMHNGKFKGRQPESLSADEWQAIGTAASRVS